MLKVRGENDEVKTQLVSCTTDDRSIPGIGVEYTGCVCDVFGDKVCST